MTLGEILIKYRSEHGLSQRQFANMCGGVTNGYISMVEQGKNPSTGKPVVPSIEKLGLFAKAMGISLHDLIKLADDMPVALEDGTADDAHQDDDDPWALREELRRDPDRKALLKLARNGSAQDVRQAMALIDALRATNPDFYDGDDPA